MTATPASTPGVRPGPSRQGFGKERRVRQSWEYREVQRTGRRVGTTHFVLVVAPDRGCTSAGRTFTPDARSIDDARATRDRPLPARLGVTASRKVGNAVERNRMKRLVREAFRTCPELVPPGTRLVVICKRFDPELTTQAVIHQWRRVKKRLARSVERG